MNISGRSFFLARALVVAAAAGCAHPVDVTKLPTPDASALLKEVDELQSYTVQVKGSARVAVKTPQASGETGAFIAAREPGQVHLELLNFFGSPTQVLVADGASFGLYQRDTSTYYHGTTSIESLARVLPVRLTPDELVDILLGRTPRLPVPPTSVVPDADAQAYRVVLVQGERRQTLWIHPVSKRVLRSVLEGPGGYQLVFENRQTTSGLPFARKVTYSDATNSVVLRWSPEDLELEGTLEPALFRVSPPPGARVVEVDGKAPGAG
jgi:hypothetical protein